MWVQSKTAKMAFMKSLFEIAKLIYPESARKRARFVFRTVVRGKKYIDEMQVVFELGKLKDAIAANPKQYEKIFRPYLFASLKLSDRMKYVKNHYEFIVQNWSKRLIDAVYVDRYFELAKMRFSDDAESSFSIILSREPSFANEGEIYIAVCDANGSRIFALNFNFTKSECGNGILIGCMQCPASDDARNVVKQLTKEMHGLRPHHLLTFALQQIAQVYKLCEVIAVTTAGHVYNATGRGERIKTDYDGFWEEASGNKINDNFYALPLIEERKSMEEIKSNKRAMYRRRFEMMDDISEQIRISLSTVNE